VWDYVLPQGSALYSQCSKYAIQTPTVTSDKMQFIYCLTTVSAVQITRGGMLGWLFSDELEGIWKGVLVAIFEVLYWNLPRVTEKNQKKFQQGQPVSGTKSETSAYGKECRPTERHVRCQTNSEFLPNTSPPPMPPHVLMNFCCFPPGCGDSAADFW